MPNLSAVSKLFRPPTNPVGGGSPHDIASEAPCTLYMKSACVNPNPTTDYEIINSRIETTVNNKLLRSEEIQSMADPTFLAIPNASKSAGLPTRIFRSIRNNLGRVGGKQTASERLFADGAKEKKMLVFRRDPLEEQSEISKRVSHYLTEIYYGIGEPHPLFVGEKEPPISFTAYVQRLIELTNKWVEESDGPESFGVRCALLAVEYLERVDVRLDGRSVHRYFMAAFLIAIKLLYDYYISNSFWAEVSGCPRKQVNQMEIQLCRILRWDFTVDEEIHAKFMRRFIIR